MEGVTGKNLWNDQIKGGLSTYRLLVMEKGRLLWVHTTICTRLVHGLYYFDNFLYFLLKNI